MKTKQTWELSEMFGIPADKLQRNLREHALFLDLNAKKIAEIVQLYHPLQLLKMACWEYQRIDKTIKNDDGFAKTVSLVLIRYIQSVVVSSRWAPRTGQTQTGEVKQKDWKRLYQLMEDLCKRTSRYIDYQILLYRASGYFHGRDELLDAYRNLVKDSSFGVVTPVSETEGSALCLRARLRPFSHMIEKSFGCSLDTLVDAFFSLAQTAHNGIDTLKKDATEFRISCTIHLEMLRAEGALESNQVLMERIVKEQNWEPRVASISGRRDGYDLYDVKKLTELAQPALDALSMKPGEDEAFFSKKEQNGWLLSQMPVTRKPFLNLNGSYYCFTGLTILSEAYDGIKSIVLDAHPELSEEWGYIEMEQRAGLPVRIVNQLLPGTMLTTPVGYDLPDGNSSYLDAVFSREDAVVVVQVPKGHGGELPSSLLDHPKDVIEFLNDVLLASSTIASAVETGLGDHQVIGIEVDSDDVGVQLHEKASARDGIYHASLFDLIRLSAMEDGPEQFQNLLGLSVIKIYLPQEPVFAKQEVAVSPFLEIFDDRPVDYDAYGFDDEIDPFEPEEPESEAEEELVVEEVISQEPLFSDEILADIAMVLERREVTSSHGFLKWYEQADSLTRSNTARLLDQALALHRKDGKDKMFTIGATHITLMLLSNRLDRLGAMNRKNSIGAIMTLEEASSWNVLNLQYNTASGALEYVEEETIEQSSFTASEWKVVMLMVDELKRNKKS